MKSRGATKAELDLTSTRFLAAIRSRVDPSYEPTYRCAGGCEDSGWVTIDEGLDAAGKRVKAPTVRKCSKCNGSFPKPETQPRRRFS